MVTPTASPLHIQITQCGDLQIPGARFVRRQHFERWRLKYGGRQYETFFTSPFWRPEFGNSY